MTILARISDFVSDTAFTAFSSAVEQFRTVFEGDAETRAKVSFSVAMIALSAKMAKADGVVTEDEVDAFRQIFEFPDSEARRVASLYNLAKQDTAGFESYARQMANLCGDGKRDCAVLYDILDGLFHIAKADGVIHESEMAFLRTVAEIFGLSEHAFDGILARHVQQSGAMSDPWRILGLSPDTDFKTAHKHYLKLVREHHPDTLAARGLPDEFARIAHDRIAAINHAWSVIEPGLRR